MDMKQPSYRKHTRASLSRVTSTNDSPPKKHPDVKSLEQRQNLVMKRLNLAEKFRQLTPPSERWPTQNSVRTYRKIQAKLPARQVIPEQRSRTLTGNHNSSGGAFSPNSTSSPLAKFPFPIHTSGDMSTFPQFSQLPGELRILIWKEAISVPKFIELPYYTDEKKRGIIERMHWADYTPPRVAQIINFQQYEPLLSVCVESREVVKAMSLHGNILSHLEIIQDGPRRRNRQQSILNPLPVFVPERDTIFFRPMDHSLENSLRSLPSDFAGNLNHLEHIAIPLDLSIPIPRASYWVHEIRLFPKLKTLTFMVGCEEKSWRGYPSIELRNVEQWFVDGRKRSLDVEPTGLRETLRGSEKDGVDVSELGAFVRQCLHHRKHLSVRVVAWKRKVSG